MEFSVLIGESGQGYLENYFPLLLQEQVEKIHRLLTKHPVTVSSICIDQKDPAVIFDTILIN